MTQCPKCQYLRTAMDAQVNAGICPACGIVYAKWIARQQQQEVHTEASTTELEEESPRESFREFITSAPPNIDPGVFWVRVATLAGFTLWSFYFISAGVDWEKIGGSFLHNINLPFHEFGHIFFRPFGRFMTILGGSLFQVLMPLGLMLVFMFKQRDMFAASIMLWWCGQNFIDISPYIADGQYRMLPLVGGGGEESHDWGNLLTMFDAVERSYRIAHVSFVIGAGIILLALAWSAIVLYKQKQQLRQDE